MRKKSLIWMLALSLIFGMISPVTALAEDGLLPEELELEELPEDMIKNEPVKHESAAVKQEAPKAESEVSETEESEEETSEEETSEAETSEEETSEAETEASDELETPETDEPLPGESESEPEQESESEQPETQIPETEPVEDEKPVEETQPEKPVEALIAPSSFMIWDHFNFPVLRREFRYTWDQDAPIAYIEAGTLIYEEKADSARLVGKSETGSKVYILADEGEEWVFVESGKVRGFVRQEWLKTLDDSVDEESMADARTLMSTTRNKAMDYTMTTGTNPVVEAVYMLASEDVQIYDTTYVESANATAVGKLKKDGKAYVLEEVTSDVYYVESGEVRGFVAASAFIRGEDAVKTAMELGDGAITEAQSLVDPEDNAAIHYTVTSVKAANDEAAIRTSLVDFASQFLGGQYVWGGTNLGVGVDCSGFVQQIFKEFGYRLPRTSWQQSVVGERIEIGEALPGDLIFYLTDGEVHHVSIYAGNGKVVHAKSAREGIVKTGIAPNAAWAVRIIK